MSVEIYGVIEGLKEDKWHFIREIDVDQSYDSFGSLFGVKNYTNLPPIAPARGIPEDASEETKILYKASIIRCNSIFGETYITQSEIENIDWEEEAENYDDRVHTFVKGIEGWIPDGKTLYTIYSNEKGKIIISKDTMLEKGKTEMIVGGKLYKLKKLKRKECLTQSWLWLFYEMKELKKQYNEVRLIVWFSGRTDEEKGD